MSGMLWNKQEPRTGTALERQAMLPPLQRGHPKGRGTSVPEAPLAQDWRIPTHLVAGTNTVSL